MHKGGVPLAFTRGEDEEHQHRTALCSCCLQVSVHAPCCRLWKTTRCRGKVACSVLGEGGLVVVQPENSARAADSRAPSGTGNGQIAARHQVLPSCSVSLEKEKAMMREKIFSQLARLLWAFLLLSVVAPVMHRGCSQLLSVVWGFLTLAVLH